jgi:hypothetical protein
MAALTANAIISIRTRIRLCVNSKNLIGQGISVPIKIFLMSVMLISGCSRPRGACTDYIANISKPPNIEAEQSLKIGDFRLLSIHSFTDIVPGVDDRKLIEQMGTKLIEHTSDNWPDESCKNYQKVAFEYAKKYNAYIISNYSK